MSFRLRRLLRVYQLYKRYRVAVRSEEIRARATGRARQKQTRVDQLRQQVLEKLKLDANDRSVSPPFEGSPSPLPPDVVRFNSPPRSPSPPRRREAFLSAVERIGHVNAWLRNVKKELKARRSANPGGGHDVPAEVQNASEDGGDADADRYRVEELLDERILNGRRQVLIRWVGYQQPTWEPVENCDDCEGLLRQLNKDIDPAYESDVASEIDDIDFQ